MKLKRLLFVSCLLAVTGICLGQSCFLSSYNSSLNHYMPVYGFQLPSGNYRLLCVEQAAVADLPRPYIIDIDAQGSFLSATTVGIAGNFGYRIEPNNVTHDKSGNLYFRYRAEVPKYDSLPYGFVKINADGSSGWNTFEQGSKYGVRALANGNIISFTKTPYPAFEVNTPGGARVSLSQPLPVTNPYQFIEDGKGHILFSEYSKDSFVVYKADTNGAIVASKRFQVYPSGIPTDSNYKALYAGKTQLFVKDNAIYLGYTKHLDIINYYQVHLAKLDMGLTPIWDKPIGDTMPLVTYLNWHQLVPVQTGGFLLAQAAGLGVGLDTNPYIGTGGIYFHYLNEQGDLQRQFSVSTRPTGWMVNDSIGSIAWFQPISVTQTNDKGLLITCNMGAEDKYYKGAYAVFKTDSNGKICATADVAIGEKELFKREESILVYPNPSNGVLNVVVPTAMASGYEIFDIAGKSVLKGVVTEFSENEPIQIPVGTLRKGFYVLSLKLQGNHEVTRKFVLQ